MSRGLGRVQRGVIEVLHQHSHWGAPSWRLAELVLGLDEWTPAARASISRALRPLIARGWVTHFTVPSIAWDREHGTEGRRLALWNSICYRRAGLPQPRKYFKLTKRGRKALGLHVFWSEPQGSFLPPDDPVSIRLRQVGLGVYCCAQKSARILGQVSEISEGGKALGSPR